MLSPIQWLREVCGLGVKTKAVSRACWFLQLSWAAQMQVQCWWRGDLTRWAVYQVRITEEDGYKETEDVYKSVLE